MVSARVAAEGESVQGSLGDDLEGGALVADRRRDGRAGSVAARVRGERRYEGGAMRAITRLGRKPQADARS